MMRTLSEPIYLPRWVLVLKYAFFVVLAALTAIRGLATLDLTTPASYTPIWSAAVALGALVALPASLSPKLESVEKWAAAWIAGWLAFIAVGAAYTSTTAGWLFVALVTLLPAGRALQLFSKRHPA